MMYNSPWNVKMPSLMSCMNFVVQCYHLWLPDCILIFQADEITHPEPYTISCGKLNLDPKSEKVARFIIFVQKNDLKQADPPWLFHLHVTWVTNASSFRFQSFRFQHLWKDTSTSHPHFGEALNQLRAMVFFNEKPSSYWGTPIYGNLHSGFISYTAQMA